MDTWTAKVLKSKLNSCRADQKKKVAEEVESPLAPPLLSLCEHMLGVRMMVLRRELTVEPLPLQVADRLLDIQQQQGLSLHPRPAQ